jgi:ABC-2 type transport system ATP-binding protein
MAEPIVTHALLKRFRKTTALDALSINVPEGSVVGLVGRNGAGKSTLLRTIAGLYLPTGGRCETLGTPVAQLSATELAQLGFLDQEAKYLCWMRVKDHLDYVSRYYATWDKALERRLVRELDVDTTTRVGKLSPGNRQKLGILMAVCYRPRLLLLDEPVSALDPIARDRFMRFLMELLRDEIETIVVSSHILHDVERLVDRLICLEHGRLVRATNVDELQESYAEWTVTATEGRALPTQFDESYIIRAETRGAEARLIVRDPVLHRDDFRRRYRVLVSERPLNLEQIFPILLDEAA